MLVAQEESCQIVKRKFRTDLLLSVPEQERPVEAGDGDGHEFDRDQQPTDDGFWRRRGKDEM